MGKSMFRKNFFTNLYKKKEIIIVDNFSNDRISPKNKKNIKLIK